jgi:hypothetical protein
VFGLAAAPLKLHSSDRINELIGMQCIRSFVIIETSEQICYSFQHCLANLQYLDTEQKRRQT